MPCYVVFQLVLCLTTRFQISVYLGYKSGVVILHNTPVTGPVSTLGAVCEKALKLLAFAALERNQCNSACRRQRRMQYNHEDPAPALPLVSNPDWVCASSQEVTVFRWCFMRDIGHDYLHRLEEMSLGLRLHRVGRNEVASSRIPRQPIVAPAPVPYACKQGKIEVMP